MDKIDLKDRKILYELDINARQTLLQIGKNVRLPKSVVAYRIKKLEEKGIIKNFYTVINFYKLGYVNLAIYVNYQYYTPAIEKEIINYFVNSDYSWWVANIQGKYDLLVLFLVKDLNDFFSFWKKTLNKYKFYFQECVIAFLTKTYSYPHSFLLDDYKRDDWKKMEIVDGGKKVDIDGKDLQILHLMALNARISLKEIAEKLNSSTTMINYRIKKLIKIGVIQGFRINIDFSKFDLQQFKVHITLKNYEKMKNIINYVKFYPNLTYMNEMIDHCDLGLNFYLHNFHELHPFIKGIYNKFPNDIKNHCTFTFPEVYKSNYLPGELTKRTSF
jgi:DNA-binding Lrp family transcriptional regulator